MEKAEETHERRTAAPHPWRERMTFLGLAGLAAGLTVGLPALKPKPAPAPLLPPGQRKAMPDFTFRILDGFSWTLSQHRGHVVLLNFWATWCPPCQEETPDLVRLAGKYQAQGLDVVGVTMDHGDGSNVRSFAAAYHVPYPILLPTPFAPVTNVVQALPTTYLIDRRGRVAQVFVGARDEASLRPELERLLQEPGAG